MCNCALGCLVLHILGPSVPIGKLSGLWQRRSQQCIRSCSLHGRSCWETFRSTMQINRKNIARWSWSFLLFSCHKCVSFIFSTSLSLCWIFIGCLFDLIWLPSIWVIYAVWQLVEWGCFPSSAADQRSRDRNHRISARLSADTGHSAEGLTIWKS